MITKLAQKNLWLKLHVNCMWMEVKGQVEVIKTFFTNPCEYSSSEYDLLQSLNMLKTTRLDLYVTFMQIKVKGHVGVICKKPKNTYFQHLKCYDNQIASHNHCIELHITCWRVEVKFYVTFSRWTPKVSVSVETQSMSSSFFLLSFFLSGNKFQNASSLRHLTRL